MSDNQTLNDTNDEHENIPSTESEAASGGQIKSSATSPDVAQTLNTPHSSASSSAGPLPKKAATTRRNKTEEREDQTTQTLKVVKLLMKDLFVDRDGRAYITLRMSKDRDDIHHVLIDSDAFKEQMTTEVYSAHKQLVSSETKNKVVFFLVAKARQRGNVQDVFVRIGHSGDAIYVDRGDRDLMVVEITASGYREIPSSEVPIKFIRHAGSAPLPSPTPQDQLPDHGRALTWLRDALNLSDSPFALVLAFILGCFNPERRYPHLALQSNMGNGKSTLAGLIRRLVDPNSGPLQSEPRSEHDLMITATKSFLLAIDNVSGLPTWLSDLLCRLAYGQAFRVRRMYTNSDEDVLNVARPAILTGIDLIAARNDLADRTMTVALERIPGEKRKTPTELDDSFTQAYPDMLGAIYGAVSTALSNRGQVELPQKPRMAGFAVWVQAGEPALPLKDGEFFRAYQQNISATAEANVEGDQVAAALLETLTPGEEWTLSITELKAKLSADGDAHGIGRLSAIKLRTDLIRAQPALERVGIEITSMGRTGPTRRSCYRISRRS